MQRRQLYHLLVLTASLALSGCLPATWTVVPEVRGRVMTPTGDPAAGAKVRIAPADASSKQREIEVTADARGQFRRKEQTQWTMVVLLPLDAIAPEFIATASRGGLDSAPKRFGGGITNPHHFGLTNKSASFDLGDLVLRDGAGGP